MLSTVMFLFLFLYLPGIIFTAAANSSISVTQNPRKVMILRGTNITFHCVVPGSLRNSGIEVHWKKEGENEYLQRGADSRKIFTLKDNGDGLFELLTATIRDSGIYHCAVMREQRMIGKGTGSHLTVNAAPTPLKISPTTPERNSSAFLILVCETAEFYPSDLTLVWYKNGVETATGINYTKRQNTEGLYEVTSPFEETQPVPNGAVYICLVSHASLRTPAIANYTVINCDPGSADNSLYIWAPGCAVGGLAFLVLVIFIGTRWRLQKNEGKEECVRGPNRPQELEAAAETVHYAALDLNRSRKTSRREIEAERTVYAQTEQGTARDKLTYAAIALTGSEKTGKYKNNERSTEYAQLKTKKQRGVKEAVYTEAGIN